MKYFISEDRILIHILNSGKFLPCYLAKHCPLMLLFYEFNAIKFILQILQLIYCRIFFHIAQLISSSFVVFIFKLYFYLQDKRKYKLKIYTKRICEMEKEICFNAISIKRIEANIKYL